MRRLLCISNLKHKANNWVGSKINSLVGPQEPLLATVKGQTFMVWACHTPQQSLQNHPSGHLGSRVMLWSVEEMLDGHERVDIPARARTAHKGLLLKRLE